MFILFIFFFDILRPQVVKPGMKLTLSSMIDVKNFSAGGHQLGIGLEFAA